MITSIEQLARQLGALYSRYGYMSYSMSKFEEYELYLRNKDFSRSEVSCQTLLGGLYHGTF